MRKLEIEKLRVEDKMKLKMQKVRLDAELEKMKVVKGETETEQQPVLEKMERKEAGNWEDIKRKDEENLLHQQWYLMEMYFQRNMSTGKRTTDGEFFKFVYISFLTAIVSMLHLKISYFEEYKTFFQSNFRMVELFLM